MDSEKAICATSRALDAKYSSMLRLFTLNNFTFGITLDSEYFMKVALETDATDEIGIATELVMRQYPFLAYKPQLVKSVTVMDDEKCIVVKRYGESKPDRRRVAYVELDSKLLIVGAKRDAHRPTLCVIDKDNQNAGFYAICPPGNMARKMGTYDFVLAYESFGGFLDGSHALSHGFSMLFAPDIATYRKVIAGTLARGKK